MLAPVDAPGESPPRRPLGAPAGGAGGGGTPGAPADPAGEPPVVAFFTAAMEFSSAEMSPPPCTMDASMAPAEAGAMALMPD